MKCFLRMTLGKQKLASFLLLGKASMVLASEGRFDHQKLQTLSSLKEKSSAHLENDLLSADFSYVDAKMQMPYVSVSFHDKQTGFKTEIKDSWDLDLGYKIDAVAKVQIVLIYYRPLFSLKSISSCVCLRSVPFSALRSSIKDFFLKFLVFSLENPIVQGNPTIMCPK